MRLFRRGGHHVVLPGAACGVSQGAGLYARSSSTTGTRPRPAARSTRTIRPRSAGAARYCCLRESMFGTLQNRAARMALPASPTCGGTVPESYLPAHPPAFAGNLAEICVQADVKGAGLSLQIPADRHRHHYVKAMSSLSPSSTRAWPATGADETTESQAA